MVGRLISISLWVSTYFQGWSVNFRECSPSWHPLKQISPYVALGVEAEAMDRSSGRSNSGISSDLMKIWEIITRWDPLPNLVGGFNPFEKYQSNWKPSPNRGENKKIFETTTWITWVITPITRLITPVITNYKTIYRGYNSMYHW